MRIARPRPFRHLIAASLGSGVLLTGMAASATSFTVNSTSDTHDSSPGNNVCRDSTGKCSLRAAIEEANAHAGWDAITLQAATYKLSLGELVVKDDLDMYGASRTGTIIDAQAKNRVIRVVNPNPDGWVYTADMTIKNGRGKSGQSGIGVKDELGDFYADRVTFTDNVSVSAQGGGVAVTDIFVCTDCEITNNQTPIDAGGGTQHAGGGVFLFAGSSGYIYQSTIAGNKSTRAGGIGGGGFLEMWQCTVSGNTALAGGGGLGTTSSDAGWGVAYSTITKNIANTGGALEPALGGGFFHRTGSLEIGKSIIAGNTDNRFHGNKDASPDCGVSTTANVVLSHWDNIFGNIGHQCIIRSTLGGTITGIDQYGQDANSIDVKLGPLENNGGSTRTHALLAGSPAIDRVTHGNPTSWWMMECPFEDQTRTHNRPQRGACDVGSYEAP